jgi:DNA-binding NarL/FixJ family response regulator
VEAAQAQAFVEHAAHAGKLCLLESLSDMTLGDMLRAVRAMTTPSTAAAASRHLQPVPDSMERQALAALSERELEVVRLVAEGLSNKEISSRLSLSDKTVKNHISHILAKMNLSARTQVAVYAIRAGLV